MSAKAENGACALLRSNAGTLQEALLTYEQQKFRPVSGGQQVLVLPTGPNPLVTSKSIVKIMKIFIKMSMNKYSPLSVKTTNYLPCQEITIMLVLLHTHLSVMNLFIQMTFLSA